jgi:hypothetical protein
MRRSTKTQSAESIQIAVLMPTYNQAAFLPRAISSLLDQKYGDWRLVIIDDGSTDDTRNVLKFYERLPQLDIVQLDKNRGLGSALNIGLDRSNSEYVAYLPSDDVYFTDHLASLVAALTANPSAILAYSGMRSQSVARILTKDKSLSSLQLVQVIHRRVEQRWLERSSLTTDNLDWMFWDNLREHGPFVALEKTTCEWTSHPHQRHRVILEDTGGLNTYRSRFQVSSPLIFQSSMGSRVDEPSRIGALQHRQRVKKSTDPLRILLLGELSYNPERILALEDRGHTLLGLWMPNPRFYNSVGPLPFGQVMDLDSRDIRGELRRNRPDIVYALLNFQAIPFISNVLPQLGSLPVVWHFKESPFLAMKYGHWNELVNIYTYCSGAIFPNSLTRDWFEAVVPGLVSDLPHMFLDGELPNAEWFEMRERKDRQRDKDGEVHTVAIGRPMGITRELIAPLAAAGIHTHFYGAYSNLQFWPIVAALIRDFPGHVHLHDDVEPFDWVKEFSQYDAGWLHIFKSENYGQLHRLEWQDMNLPSRRAILAAAGVPPILRSNEGALVAQEIQARTERSGLFFSGAEELATMLSDDNALELARSRTWDCRENYIFDRQVVQLERFFLDVIARDSGRTMQ